MRFLSPLLPFHIPAAVGCPIIQNGPSAGYTIHGRHMGQWRQGSNTVGTFFRKAIPKDCNEIFFWNGFFCSTVDHVCPQFRPWAQIPTLTLGTECALSFFSFLLPPSVASSLLPLPLLFRPAMCRPRPHALRPDVRSVSAVRKTQAKKTLFMAINGGKKSA